MTSPIPERLAELAKDGARIKAEQEELTARRRRAVFDAYTERYSFVDIGRMLGVSGERARQDYERFLAEYPDERKQ
jgi:DNA-directed RNA polymerase specialized sigma24 family protein